MHSTDRLANVFAAQCDTSSFETPAGSGDQPLADRHPKIRNNRRQLEQISNKQYLHAPKNPINGGEPIHDA
jgi:hypothetical protein